MNNLLQFFYSLRTFFLFLLFEFLALYLYYTKNTFAYSQFFNTTNYYVGSIEKFKSDFISYLYLTEINSSLAEQNRFLLKELTFLRNQKIENSAVFRNDSIVSGRFSFFSAKIINNSIHQVNNYLTLDKGIKDGVKIGMGVISAHGMVVGKVINCSENFSLVSSILHSNFKISSQIKRTGSIGTSFWEGKNPNLLRVTEINKNETIFKGDTIVTSRLNSIFPEGILIGIVETSFLNKNQIYNELEIKTPSSLQKLKYVYFVENKLLNEQKNLENSANASEK